MEITEQLKAELARLIETAEEIASVGGPNVTTILRDGLESPLSPIEVERVLARVVAGLTQGARDRGDQQTIDSLGSDVEVLIHKAMQARSRVRAAADEGRPLTRVQTVHLLEDFNNVRVHPVVPRPVFHEKEIPMNCGYVKTTQIRLWEANERLEIHVRQFEAKHVRSPSATELLEIMLGRMSLEGLDREDQFEITALARSIAANGVQKPPIIDIDGTLLDGNRRVAACYLILNDTSGEFTPEDKKRVEHTFVWQLTPDALDEDRTRIIVALNFEDDRKLQWPEYIKARKVFDDWEDLLALEPHPNKKKQQDLKRQLSKRYALGPDPSVVTRYIRMVRWASEFEEHHINARKRDKFAVKHAANRYFQYFDELSKGESTEGGVGWTLNNDDTLRATTFDLLFDGKFSNWAQVRQLKKVAKLDEAREILAKAHVEPDVDRAADLLEDAITIAKTRDAEERSLGANLRIETFVKWLEEIPPRMLRDNVKPANLTALLRALQLVEGIVKQGIDQASTVH